MLDAWIESKEEPYAYNNNPLSYPPRQTPSKLENQEHNDGFQGDLSHIQEIQYDPRMYEFHSDIQA